MKKIIIAILAITLLILGNIICDRNNISLKTENDVIILSNRIQALIFEKEYDEALELCNKILKKYPDSADVLLKRANIYRYLKNYKSALEDYNQIISMKDNKNVDLADVYSGISNIYYDMKEYQKALDSLDKSIDINPNKCGLYYLKSEIKSKMSDYKNAIEYSTKAIECDPYKSVYYMQRMDLYSILKDKVKSEKDRAKGYEMIQFSKEVNDIRTLIYENKNEEAIVKCDELIKKYPTSTELIKIRANILQKR